MCRVYLAFVSGDSMLECDGRGFATIFNAELDEDVGNVRRCRAAADVELLANLHIGEALANQLQHLPLAPGEVEHGHGYNVDFGLGAIRLGQ